MYDRRTVDIIVPVYNAYEDLKLCIESLIRYTDLKICRLIFINDNSSDNRIKAYLEKINQQSIIVINNTENKGFSANVNKGISLSEADIVLLNSDTIVTKRWVEKLLECAYSKKEIATVTPLSNNATLCSVPEFCQENTLPKNVTLDEMAAIVEAASCREYPEIPVANGFCMFIKRSVINEVGKFDEKTFKKGYGEENDFCYRAAQLGYIHVMCDDTFIYHKGTGSFANEEKLAYIEEHKKILEQRYPKEEKAVHSHWLCNPNRHIFKQIDLYLDLNKHKKNILYLLHSDFREGTENNCGGTQLHVKDLTLALRKNYNIFVAARNGEYLSLTIYTEKNEYYFKYFIGIKKDYFAYNDENIKHVLENILDVFKIQIVHIHHLSGLSHDIYDVAYQRNIPIYTTLHDYYFICPTVKLYNYRNEVCIDKENCTTCKKCLKHYFNISETVNFLPAWRRRNEEALSLSTGIFVPSSSAKSIVCKYFPQLEDKIQIIEHGSDRYVGYKYDNENKKFYISENVKSYLEEATFLNNNILYLRGWIYKDDVNMENCDIVVEISDSRNNKSYTVMDKVIREDVAQGNSGKRLSGYSSGIVLKNFEEDKFIIRIYVYNKKNILTTDGKVHNLARVSSNTNKKFRVAFIGGLSVEKGAKKAYEMICGDKSNSIEWYIFGEIGYPFLKSLDKKNLIKMGKYDRGMLEELLAGSKIDLICILPVWPETFCYTLSEAVLSGIPVLVTQMGALEERVKEMRCGWLAPAESKSDDILKMIYTILNKKDKYREIKDIIRKSKIRCVNDMVNDYINLYANSSIDVTYKNVTDKIKRSVLENYSESNLSADRKILEEMRILNNKVYRLNAIEQSTSFKIINKVFGMKIPFRNAVKKISCKILKI